MDAKELRIGNWYQWYAEGKYYDYKVKDIDFCNGNMPNFEPIPLTEELIKRFGFEKLTLDLDSEFDIYELDSFFILKKVNVFAVCIYGMFLDMNKDFEEFDKIEFVHDLQNLFYALKRKDLTLK